MHLTVGARPYMQACSHLHLPLVPGCIACLPSGAALLASPGEDARVLLAGQITQSFPCRAPILDAVAADLAGTGQNQVSVPSHRHPGMALAAATLA